MQSLDELSKQLDQITVAQVNEETEMYDAMQGAARWEVKIHNHGRCSHTPACTIELTTPHSLQRRSRGLHASTHTRRPNGRLCDRAERTRELRSGTSMLHTTENCAWQGTKKVEEDAGLIRYLLRHHHTNIILRSARPNAVFFL
ncbi:Hypothetical protein UVM_LOCUS84 [uncultured virus]|nr:Hypothetical protein UVM_LOCUS84 [uncultured virus]